MICHVTTISKYHVTLWVGPLILNHHPARFGVHRPNGTENNGACSISSNSNSNSNCNAQLSHNYNSSSCRKQLQRYCVSLFCYFLFFFFISVFFIHAICFLRKLIFSNQGLLLAWLMQWLQIKKNNHDKNVIRKWEKEFQLKLDFDINTESKVSCIWCSDCKKW